MEVIGKNQLEVFSRGHSNAKKPIARWLTLVELTAYNNLIELRKTFNDPDDIGDGQIVFNIGGNKFRLAVLIDFEDQIVQILKVMTHSEYDKWNERRSRI